MATAEHARVPLWRDVRVLQWAFQIAVVAVVLAIGLWVLGNYTENSSRQNIPTGFGFLDNPAAFEITGNDLSQNAPVSDALIQGVLNTLRVSIVGVVLATVLGTLVGVARLSRNWLVRTAAAAYVEAIRNVPLPLFVIMGSLAIVLGIFPRIEDAWRPLGLAVVLNRGIAVPWFVGSGWVLVTALAVAAAAAWAVGRWRSRVFDRSGTPPRSGWYGAAAVAVVLAAAWFVFGFDATTPTVEGRFSAGGIRIDPSYFAILFALVVYTASHIAEIVRGSIQAVPRGQGEAADSLALGAFQRMWYVVLPQAFRIAIPPIGNQYLNLIKNSSLGAAIGYYDLTLVTQTTVGNGSPAVPAFALALAIYLAISLVTSALVNVANRRVALVER